MQNCNVARLNIKFIIDGTASVHNNMYSVMPCLRINHLLTSTSYQLLLPPIGARLISFYLLTSWYFYKTLYPYDSHIEGLLALLAGALQR